jgi:glycosyltransferase involved in cell wall biosynthesis
MSDRLPTGERSVELAVVMPVYNEAECIAGVIESWRAELCALGMQFRILAIDDGSTDETAEILRRLGDEPWLQIIAKRNSGHGPTLLVGYANAAAAANWTFQCDSDGEMNPLDFAALWNRRDDFDALFGVRQRPARNALRRGISAGARAVVALLFGTRVADVNVPFRLIRSDVLRAIVPRIPPDTFAPNAMIAGALSKSDARIYNHPLRNRPRQTGRSAARELKVVRGTLRALWQTVAFAWRLRFLNSRA